jgi:hypothetical protein
VIQCRWPLLHTDIGILFLTGGLIHSTFLQQLVPQTSPQDISVTDRNAISFDLTPLIQFVGKMMGRLDITIVPVDRIKLQGSVALHKEIPVAKQDLLDLLTERLRVSDAVLVRSRSVMHIVKGAVGNRIERTGRIGHFACFRSVPYRGRRLSAERRAGEQTVDRELVL